MKVARVASPIATINSEVSTVAPNFMRVCADLPAIGAQLLPRCAFALVLTIFTHIAVTCPDISTKVTTIRSDVSGVGSNLFPIRSQLAAFRRLKPATV
jgi:hypothetical protein